MKRLFIIQALLLLLLYPIAGFGFNLSVTHTNETCPGNGALAFTVTNTDPAGSIVYIIYKLPDVTTPYSSGTYNTVNGLAAGNYRIIAKETVGSATTTKQQDATITSSFEPLIYSVQALNQACSATSTISVLVNSGNAATYEIISGPRTFAPQTSNTFSGLAVGVYKVRVIDTCGNSVVQTFTVTLNPTKLDISNPVFTDTTPASCTSVIATNEISAAPGTVIGYPLQVQYVLHLPGGNTTINTNLVSGDPESQTISLTIPYQSNQSYDYDITITDACGTTYPTETFVVRNSIKLSVTIIHLPCNQYYFSLDPSNASGSYSLQFTNAPAGFNPAAFNSSYPGPYNQSKVDFGSDSQPTPFGDYTVTITDSCGKTFTLKFSIVDKPPIPTIVSANNGCLTNSGSIKVSIPAYNIITAIVTAAPTSYPFPIPHNVTSSISGGVLNLDSVPLGDYTIDVTDDCGDVINPLSVTVAAYEDKGVTTEILQGCGIGRASIRITSNNNKLTSVKITTAPEGFSSSLPFDISNNIVSSGELYLADLVSGNYTFSTTDACNFTSNTSVIINGYAVTSRSFSLTANCGSFNIPLNFVDNVSSDETFWLQKQLDATTGSWGNPATDEVYTEVTAPNTNNSYPLQNNTTNINLTFNGVFRIVHQFTSYNSGSDLNNNTVSSEVKNCIEVLSPTLTFKNALAINDVYRVPCSSSGVLDVLLEATGTPPLHYRTIEKDGVPFIRDNGSTSVFLNMEPGIYKFEVEDSCGNSVNRTFDVSDLTALVRIFPICDLFNCATTITGNETFDLSSQTATILGGQSPSEYTLSYHTSQADANNNTNPITNLTSFNPVSNPQTIYIRLIFNQLRNCEQTGSFDLITGQSPKINLTPEYVVCDTQPIQLDASAGNLPTTTYSWSNGVNTPDVTISNPGITTLTITATNTYGTCNDVPMTCATSKDITVTIAELPEILRIDSEDWTDNENTITVVTTQTGAFEYSLDGINYQDNPTFTNLKPGLYTVFVRDINGCKTVTQEIWLLNYPKFFTPNDDGYNDTWYVKNSENEPNFKVFIYDRYGKLITNILSNTPGWDGKLNGRLLFADDYWFTAYREDGRILRGHFALKR